MTGTTSSATSGRQLFRPPAPVVREGRPGPWRVLRGLLRADFSHYPKRAYERGIYSVPLLGRKLWLPTGPEAVRTVLVTQQAAYPKSAVMQRILAPLIGQSMFVTNGEVWARQRRMVDPTLELSRLKLFMAPMQGAVDDMIMRIGAQVDAGQAEMDIDTETMRVTADILCRTVFSEQVDADFVDTLSEAFRRYQALAPWFLTVEALGLPHWVLPHKAAAARREGARIRAYLAKLIEDRLATPGKGRPEDLLSGLIAAEDPETGYRFTQQDLVDEVVFFFLAGHETSASALSWAFYLLANDDHVQTRVADEIATHLGDAPPEFSGLRKLRLSRDVFREALRLYPPVTSFIRDPIGPQILRERQVKAKDLVAVTPWFVHRSERNWSHPDMFDPDRFQTEAGLASMRASFLPFNTGPRVCSGAAFATQEALLIMAEVIRRFDIRPVAGRTPQPAAWLTQRSRNGTWVRLTRR